MLILTTAGDAFQEPGQRHRIGRHHCRLLDAERAVVVTLVLPPPENLGRVLLAGEEHRLGKVPMHGEGEGEGHLLEAAVGQPRRTLEMEGLEIAKSGGAPGARLRLRIGALQNQHGAALLAGEEIAIVGSEVEDARPHRRHGVRVEKSQELEEAALLELHEAVAGAEGMARGRRKREAEMAIEIARPLQVANAKHEMIDAADHVRARAVSSPRACN